MYAHCRQGTVAFRFCDTSTAIPAAATKCTVAHVTCMVAVSPCYAVLLSFTSLCCTPVRPKTIYESSVELRPAAYAAPLPDSDANFITQTQWEGRSYTALVTGWPYHVAMKKFP